FSCVGSRCLSPTLTLLQLCQLGHAETDCAAGDECRNLFAVDPTGLGVCVTPCAAGRVCPSKSGFPQDCVDLPANRGGGSVCIIGLFGTQCTSDAGCINGLRCLAPLTITPNVRICSFDCVTHADCQSNPLAGAQSYCIGETLPNQPHVCVPQLDALAPC